MKADPRVSIKDYRRNKSLKVTLAQMPIGLRQFGVGRQSLSHQSIFKTALDG